MPAGLPLLSKNQTKRQLPTAGLPPLPPARAARAHIRLREDIGPQLVQAALQALRGAGVAAISSPATFSAAWIQDRDEPLPLEALVGHTDLVQLNLKWTSVAAPGGDWGELCRLTELTQLHLARLADTFPAQCGQLPRLPQLQSLWLGGADWPLLPAALSALTALTSLGIGGVLGGGWQHLAPLRQLQHLILTDYRLAEVPEALSGLSALTRLGLHQIWQLRGGWQHLAPLQQLCILSLCAAARRKWCPRRCPACRRSPA